MFLSRAERWQVAVAPSDAAVALPGMSGWDGGVRSFADNGDDWMAGLADLASHAGTKRVKVDVVLADALVRYAVVPWDDAVRSKKDERAHIERALEPVLGSPMSDWTVRMSPARYGKRSLACAVASDTLKKVEAKLADNRIRLGHIEPFCVRHLERLARGKTSQGTLVVRSADHMQGFGWGGDEVLWVRATADGSETARATIERAHVLSAADFAFEPTEIRLGGANHAASTHGHDAVAVTMLRTLGEA